MKRDNLTLSLNPGERETLNALAESDGHRSLAALIRSRLGLDPPRNPGRPWPNGYRGKAAAKRAARLEALEARIEKLRAPSA